MKYLAAGRFMMCPVESIDWEYSEHSGTLRRRGKPWEDHKRYGCDTSIVLSNQLVIITNHSDHKSLQTDHGTKHAKLSKFRRSRMRCGVGLVQCY